MSRPFNFFSYTDPPFILQGALLFDDNYRFDWNWSGEYSGILRDDYNFYLSSSGEYFKDVDPELYNIKFDYSGNFTGIDYDITSLSAGIDSYKTGILLDEATYSLTTTGEYTKEIVETVGLINNINRVDYSGIDNDVASIRFNIDEVDYSGVTQDDVSLMTNIPSGSFQRIATVHEKANLSLSWNGLYQKDVPI